MARFVATVEETVAGEWTAIFRDERNLVIGEGATRDEALSDLRAGLVSLIEYLKDKGEPIPGATTEVISIEIEVEV